VIRHPNNLGQGSAIITGFRACLMGDYDVIIELDGDGQHDPEDVPRFLDCFERTRPDIIVGARVWGRSEMPLHRRLNNGLVTTVGRWLSGTSVIDFQCGYRFITAETWQNVDLETTGYEMETSF
jgi:glycosyltransferase involved in cell wall biosynthesis